jgi:hypothetical protein
MANEVKLEPGPLSRDVRHAAYDVASKARDVAIKKFHTAQQAMWDAEREWTLAERRVQQAFVDLANGQLEDKK